MNEKKRYVVCTYIYMYQPPATHKGGGDVGVMLTENRADIEKEKRKGFFFSSIFKKKHRSILIERESAGRYVRGTYSPPLSMRLAIVCHKPDWPRKWLHDMSRLSSHSGSCHRLLRRQKRLRLMLVILLKMCRGPCRWP